MLKWVKNTRRSQGGAVSSESLRADLPGWGEASIHPHIHHPGELFLNCPGLGIDMHPLGQTTLEKAVPPAQAVMRQALERYAAACQEGLAAIGTTDTAESH